MKFFSSTEQLLFLLVSYITRSAAWLNLWFPSLSSDFIYLHSFCFFLDFCLLLNDFSSLWVEELLGVLISSSFWYCSRNLIFFSLFCDIFELKLWRQYPKITKLRQDKKEITRTFHRKNWDSLRTVFWRFFISRVRFSIFEESSSLCLFVLSNWTDRLKFFTLRFVIFNK